MGTWLHNPNIWHLHRHSVAKAFLIGLFWMAIPLPSQMLVAALFAIFFRANLALSVALVWISNPITMAPIFYFNYEIGTWLLGMPAQAQLHFELSWQWITEVLGDLWLPLYLGSFVVGASLGLTAYLLTHLFWRHHVLNAWQKRMQRQKAKNNPQKQSKS